MKILNLFAGIGGNRTLWNNKHEITAVEYNIEIAEIYKKRFPKDRVIVVDAYSYLEQNYKEFDLIWVSPECPTHSKLQHCQKYKRLPDMRLYSLIIFLKHMFWGKWIVENVSPYYQPLIKPTVKLGRHLFWSNFLIQKKDFKVPKGSFKDLPMEIMAKYLHIKLDVNIKRIHLRNCVLPLIGKYILDNVLKEQKNPKKIWNYFPNKN